MATFTIDLLTGNLYLFSGNFSGSGSTPTSGTTYPAVNTFGDLPTPAGSYTGQIYVVRSGTGAYVLNRKDAGMYISAGGVWRNMGDTPAYFKSSNFQVYDSVDNTKGLKFITSGITAGVFRQLKIQNTDGTIAYLTDLNTKLDKTAFADYTGTTAPATFLSKTVFNTFTGTTLPANYVNKIAFNAYTGATLLLIQGKQDALIAGKGISLVGNVISVTGSSITTLQLKDITGNQEVNNIAGASVVWSTQEFSGTSLSFTGGSRIYVRANGTYEISYALSVISQTNSPKNIATLIRKNGNVDITPLTSTTNSINNSNDTGSNIMPKYLVSLVNNDYLQLIAFRIGDTGSVKTRSNASWIRIEKK